MMPAGNRWFITGVARGIGQALAQAALARGDAVIGTARREADALAFTATHPAATGLALDIDDHGRIGSLVAQAMDAADGGIDIVVNNAGRSLWGPIEELSLDAAKSLFDTNLFAPMAVMQAFLPHFRERRAGIFVNISSGCGLFGMAGLGAYCASKFALEGLSESIAAETTAFGIRTMLVEPGAVAGTFISGGTTDGGVRSGAYPELDAGKAGLETYYQSLTLTPDIVAAQIMAALDDGEPPLRLSVGDDVKSRAVARYQAMARMMAH